MNILYRCTVDHAICVSYWTYNSLLTTAFVSFPVFFLGSASFVRFFPFSANNTQNKTTTNKREKLRFPFRFLLVLFKLYIEREREIVFLPCLLLFCVHPRAFVVVFFPSRVSVVLVELNCALMDREKVTAPNIYIYIYNHTALR